MRICLNHFSAMKIYRVTITFMTKMIRLWWAAFYTELSGLKKLIWRSCFFRRLLTMMSWAFQRCRNAVIRRTALNRMKLEACSLKNIIAKRWWMPGLLWNMKVYWWRLAITVSSNTSWIKRPFLQRCLQWMSFRLSVGIWILRPRHFRFRFLSTMLTVAYGSHYCQRKWKMTQIWFLIWIIISSTARISCLTNWMMISCTASLLLFVQIIRSA